MAKSIIDTSVSNVLTSASRLASYNMILQVKIYLTLMLSFS